MKKVAKRGSNKLIGILLLTLGLGIALITWRSLSWWSWANSSPASAETVNDPKKNAVTLKINDGSTAQEIGRELETLGLIRSAQAWNIWTKLKSFNDSKGGFKAGVYQLSRSDSMETIAATIWSGKVMQLSFTIPEGWNIKQMAAYFEKQGFFSAKDFLAAVEQVSVQEYPWIPANPSPHGFPKLEGYLYPDTYQVDAKVTPESIVRQMLNHFQETALPIYQQAKGQTNLSLHEWVTLGSIVEKESVVPKERGLIAGVFTNRLKQSMSLGSDPTVEYAFGVTQTPDQPLTFAQVRSPHPYNTYVTPGLPPGPIASPGIASLKATLAPEATDYLYFVARYDGTHVFSRTENDHLNAQDAIHDKRDAEKAEKSGKPGQ